MGKDYIKIGNKICMENVQNLGKAEGMPTPYPVRDRG
jgi:hypothetical protein